jgi:transcriptional regulator with XRE-family HTH domain
MHSGEQLGRAIEEARQKMGITKKALADRFGVKPPSIQDWVRRGTIDKEKLIDLIAFFAPVVGPEHWGLPPGATALAQVARSAGDPLGDALTIVGDALARVPPSDRDTVAMSMREWALSGGADRWRALVLASLDSSRPLEKLRAVGT